MGTLDRFLDPVSGRRLRADIEERLRTIESTRRIWQVVTMKASPVGAMTQFVSVQTSATAYTTVWRYRLPTMPGPTFDFGVFMFLTAGTQGAVRIQITDPDGVGTSAEKVTGVGGGEFHAFTCRWLHGRRLWIGDVVIDIQVRRISGDAIPVYEPARAAIDAPDRSTSLPVWVED